MKYNDANLPLIFLQPAFVPKIWGSRQLATKFNFALPPQVPIGEAWLISAHPHGMSYVSSGQYQGLSLAQLFKDYPQLFANINEQGEQYYQEYPLLTKILDANDNLSVQIHPDDSYAYEHHQTYGKTECWYILDCQPAAQVIFGHNALSQAQFASWINNEQWTALLKYVPISKGQFIYVPSLKIHGLLAKTIVFELQQSSDITYRLYDYDRYDSHGNKRTLHLDAALAIVPTPDKDSSSANGHDDYLVDNKFFKLVKMVVNGTKSCSYPQAKWLQCSVLAGKGTINGTKIAIGDSFILPHGYHDITFQGQLLVMISYCS